jgi:stage II sporulation protein M
MKKTQLDYLHELRLQIGASVFLLVVGMVLGAVGGTRFFNIDFHFHESLGRFARIFTSLPRPLLALAIFANNAVKTLLVIILGIAGGIIPVGFLLFNGYALGLVLHASTQSRGILSTLLAIAPHGLFELPAVLVGASIGLYLGLQAIKRWRGQHEINLKSDLGRGLRFFWSVILPLLLIAALIEAFITSAIVSAEPLSHPSRHGGRGYIEISRTDQERIYSALPSTKDNNRRLNTTAVINV